MSDAPDPNRFLDWFCWRVAMDGERFYPPDETAKECIEYFEEAEEDNDAIEVTDESRGWEYGQHSRAWSEAVEIYADMHDFGLDPVEHAQNEVERSREEGLDLDDIDWEWLRDSGRYGGEIPDA